MKYINIYNTVQTYNIHEVSDLEKLPSHKNRLLIATLIPGEKEFQQINFTFTCINNVVLTVEGEYPIHVIGSVSPEEEEEEEFPEEEGGEEENNENEKEEEK